jgi:hypothetical protein
VSSTAEKCYLLPHVTAFSGLSPSRARTRVEGYTPNPGNRPVTGNIPPAPSKVTILRHCRCQDCRHWIKAPYSMCRHGLVVNGMKAIPEYPAHEWHYCALYHGPQVSKEVWVWKRDANSSESVEPRPAETAATCPHTEIASCQTLAVQKSISPWEKRVEPYPAPTEKVSRQTLFGDGAARASNHAPAKESTSSTCDLEESSTQRSSGLRHSAHGLPKQTLNTSASTIKAFLRQDPAAAAQLQTSKERLTSNRSSENAGRLESDRGQPIAARNGDKL